MTDVPHRLPLAIAHRLPLAIGGAAAALVALTACSGGAADAPSASSAARLKDGTYSADGDYQSPGGTSVVGVTMTLKDGTVSAVTVVPKAENATARSYEAKFASGISDVVVGKKLTELQVGAVSGSSLTTQGFTKAVQQIEREAA